MFVNRLSLHNDSSWLLFVIDYNVLLINSHFNSRNNFILTNINNNDACKYFSTSVYLLKFSFSMINIIS